jgi:hypothetical protein
MPAGREFILGPGRLDAVGELEPRSALVIDPEQSQELRNGSSHHKEGTTTMSSSSYRPFVCLGIDVSKHHLDLAIVQDARRDASPTPPPAAGPSSAGFRRTARI